MKNKSLIDKIQAANLLGRGCGTYPTAKKWQVFLSAPGREKYIVCNCSESEPGIFKDKFILDYYPEKMIDGLKLAMETLKAAKGFIYLNPLYYSRFHTKLELLIGDDNIEVFSKPAKDYIGGEESTIVNLMEGRREQPRFHPPYVTEQGFLNKPTLVNNAETFYHISLINEDKYNQERFFCISGDNTPNGVFSLPIKLNIKQALEQSGHYPTFPFFVQLGGGVAGMCLNQGQLEDYAVNHYSGLVIHALDKNEKKLIDSWLKFFMSESCGQCVPCREGTYRLHEIYNSKEYAPAMLADIIHAMQNSTLCSLGKMATTAITSYYANIKKEAIGNTSININKCQTK